MCQCNNKTDPHVFLYSEATGKCAADKRCPECGQQFSFMYQPLWADKYLYVNNDPRYYNY